MGLFKELFEGGAQESVLADQYRGWAACSQPRCAKNVPRPPMRLQVTGRHAHREEIHGLEQDKLE